MYIDLIVLICTLQPHYNTVVYSMNLVITQLGSSVYWLFSFSFQKV